MAHYLPLLNREYYNDYKQLVAAFTPQNEDKSSYSNPVVQNSFAAVGLSQPSHSSRRVIGKLAAAALTPAWNIVRRGIGEKPYTGFEQPANSFPKPLDPRDGGHRKSPFIRKMPSRKNAPKKVHVLPGFNIPGQSTKSFIYVQPRRVQRPKPGRQPTRPRSYTNGPRISGRGRGRGRGRGPQSARMPGPRPGSTIVKPVPAARRFRTTLGTRVVPKARNGGNFVSIPVDIWDDTVSVVYPTAGLTRNYVVIGSNIADCCNDYPLAPWSSFYNPNPVRISAQSYGWFRYPYWMVKYIPAVDYTCAGEIVTITIDDPGQVVNKGLTFECTSAFRTAMTNHRIVITDYKNVGADPVNWSNNADREAQVKCWTEAHPRQFEPFDRWFLRMATKGKKWLRNHAPAGQTASNVIDYGDVDVPEIALCMGGLMCIWGSVTDSFLPTSNNQMRKIGDLMLNCMLQVKGLGTIDIQGDWFMSPASKRLLGDEKFILAMREKIMRSEVDGEPIKPVTLDVEDVKRLALKEVKMRQDLTSAFLKSVRPHSPDEYVALSQPPSPDVVDSKQAPRVVSKKSASAK